MVSAELMSSSSLLSKPDAAGEADELSLSLILPASPVAASPFIATSTEAASSNWTCWCFDIKSLDVYCHSGVCSQLYDKSGQQNDFRIKSVNRRGTSTWHGKTHRCFVRQLLCLYPFPQVSHLRSPCPDFFFIKAEPSLERRSLSPALSLSPSGGPSTSALPFFPEYWFVPFCGMLLGGDG